MRAIVTKGHGSPEVLQLIEMPAPEPKANEVRIRVHAATVTQGDVMLRKLHPFLALLMRPFGVRSKKIPGHELAGEIDAVGTGVTRFKIGDSVFGTTSGLTVGSYAEYVCLPEEWKGGALAIKPENLTYEQAAAIPVGGMTALYILQKAGIRKGQKILIYGASGSVGSYAVQIARSLGGQVTGVAGTTNLGWVSGLGAQRVIDYTREDFTASDEVYDVVFDAVGKLDPSQAKGALAADGAFLTVASTTNESLENLYALRDLIEAGKVVPVIDRTYPLAEVADAHRYVETGRKKGNVVIRIAQAGGR